MSNYSLAVNMLIEPIRFVSFGFITGTYTPIGVPLANPTCLILFQNTTNETLLFSDDGVTDKFALPASSFLLLDISSNKAVAKGLFFNKGRQFYVRDFGIVPSDGDVFMTSFYGNAASF
jgi:hypothetical protein